MDWATYHIEKLQNGETISFRPKGNSMQPKIESGQLVTVEPIGAETTINVGDILLCKVAGKSFLHLVTAIENDKRYQISNNKGHINGWTNRAKLYGKVIKIED